MKPYFNYRGIGDVFEAQISLLYVCQGVRLGLFLFTVYLDDIKVKNRCQLVNVLYL